MGRAPARHILIPLYWAGLCEAVNMAPGASSVPAAKYIMSVDASPRSTTSRPCRCTPSAKAAASSTPLGRMSRATSTRSAPSVSATNAGERRPDALGETGVELVGHRAADVVGLEDRGEGIEVGHGRLTLVAPGDLALNDG